VKLNSVDGASVGLIEVSRGEALRDMEVRPINHYVWNRKPGSGLAMRPSLNIVMAENQMTVKHGDGN